MTKQKSISPLRQRMLEDMRRRKLADSTQKGSGAAVIAGGLTPDLRASPLVAPY